MHPHYQKLHERLELARYFPNLSISYEDKEAFIARRVPITDAVIFTGTPENASKVQRYFSRRTLFILNGAGHNPLVVAEDANIPLAVESALRVVLYNQGQDCAGPNAILVHEAQHKEFRAQLLNQLRTLKSKVGPYDDRNNIVGPNTDPDHSLKVSLLFKENREYCLYGGDINPVSGLIYPTVFEKPLPLGGNYKEFFAPVFYLQPYGTESVLSGYFKDPRYFPNAMYISLFGSSSYIDLLVDTPLHQPESILRDSDLHVEEKGYLPYGGQGPSASCLYIDGKRICGATLPQRDIYLYLVKPQLIKDHLTNRVTNCEKDCTGLNVPSRSVLPCC